MSVGKIELQQNIYKISCYLEKGNTFFDVHRNLEFSAFMSHQLEGNVQQNVQCNNKANWLDEQKALSNIEMR